MTRSLSAIFAFQNPCAAANSRLSFLLHFLLDPALTTQIFRLAVDLIARLPGSFSPLPPHPYAKRAEENCLTQPGHLDLLHQTPSLAVAWVDSLGYHLANRSRYDSQCPHMAIKVKYLIQRRLDLAVFMRFKATTFATTGGASNQFSLPSLPPTINPDEVHALPRFSNSGSKGISGLKLQTT